MLSPVSSHLCFICAFLSFGYPASVFELGESLGRLFLFFWKYFIALIIIIIFIIPFLSGHAFWIKRPVRGSMGVPSFIIKIQGQDKVSFSLFVSFLSPSLSLLLFSSGMGAQGRSG
jgi:hypothetical protein